MGLSRFAVFAASSSWVGVVDNTVDDEQSGSRVLLIIVHNWMCSVCNKAMKRQLRLARIAHFHGLHGQRIWLWLIDAWNGERLTMRNFYDSSIKTFDSHLIWKIMSLLQLLFFYNFFRKPMLNWSLHFSFTTCKIKSSFVSRVDRERELRSGASRHCVLYLWCKASRRK